MENWTAAEKAIWTKNAGSKWKKLISKWKKESARRHEQSLLMSWRDNACRRGIDECVDGKSKDWETLKLEYELWESKHDEMKRQGKGRKPLGDRLFGLAHQIKHQEDPPSCSGMPMLPYSGDT